MNKITTLPIKLFQIMLLMKTILHFGALMKSTSLYRMDLTKWPCSLLSQFDALRWVIMKEKLPCWGCTMGSNRGCFQLFLSGSFYFSFLVFWSKWPKAKKSAVLFVYFLYEKSAFCLKLTAYFFSFWSFWPKNE